MFGRRGKSDDEERIDRGDGEIPGQRRRGREGAEEANRLLDIAHALITGDMSVFDDEDRENGDTQETDKKNR